MPFMLVTSEEIDTLGGNVEFYYWNVADNFEIEVPIKTKNIKD